MPRAWIARGFVVFVLLVSNSLSFIHGAHANPDVETSTRMVVPHIDDYESTLIWVWDEEGPRLEFREGNPKARKLTQPAPFMVDTIESG